MLATLLLHLALGLKREDGLRLTIDSDNADPVLLMTLPGESAAAVQIIFPEHVSARTREGSEGEHLYLYRPGLDSDRPAWKRIGQSLQYERELPHDIHMLARATMQNDGVLFHYEFTNRSNVAWDMIYAVTDPRMKSILQDVRLERTYVHHANGFDLLASEEPRFSLPARFVASYTWPVPKERIEKRDGITHYSKSRAVDEPLIATVSSDGKWVAASFTRTVGNVWSNPELTCQHVDPQKSLPAHATVTLEVKFLVMRGTLEDAQRAFQEQRSVLK